MRELQLLCNGFGGAVHSRWAFDPDLGFPVGGFDIYRRRAGGTEKAVRLDYTPFPARAPAPYLLSGGGYTVKDSGRTSSGAVSRLMPVNGVQCLVFDGGRLPFTLQPAAPRLAVTVGHLPPTTGTPAITVGEPGSTPIEEPGASTVVLTTAPSGTVSSPASSPPASSTMGTGTSASGTSSTSTVGTSMQGPTPIILEAVSPSGIERQTINPPFLQPVQVVFVNPDVQEVRIEGAAVFVQAWDIWGSSGAAGGWGSPLNGGTPIRLPRTDSNANFLLDVGTRVSAAEMATLFGTPADPQAVDALRQLVDACQPTAASRWVEHTAADGSVTSVDALGLLLLLAFRPTAARMLGLWWPDTTAQPGMSYDYRVEGHYATLRADEFLGAGLSVTQSPAPALGTTAAETIVAVRNPLSPPRRPIHVRLKAAALEWSLPQSAAQDLIDFEALLYLVQRQPLGLLAPPTATPPTPAAGAWTTLNPDAPQAVADGEDGTPLRPFYRDAPTDVDQPLEGWYAYRVVGLSIFGLQSPPSPAANVLLLDDIAPPAPRLLTGPPTGIHVGDDLDLAWTWGPGEVLSAPDTASFRIYLQERAPTVLQVRTGTVTPDQATGRATVPLTGGPLPADASQRLPGARLEIDGRSYVIVSATPGGSQHLVVALANGAGPPSGRPGTLTYLAAPDPTWMHRVATAAPQPHVAATVSGAQHDAAAGRVNAVLSPASSWSAAGLGATLYDRTTGLAFQVAAAPDAVGRVSLVPSSGFSPSTDLPAGAALVFPRQAFAVPNPLAAGPALRYLHLCVAAADARAYRPDRLSAGNQPGNEGPPCVPTMVMAIDDTPPGAPTGTDPDGPDIYASLPDFYRRSHYLLTWSANAGLRTQVYRAMDKSIFAADAERGSSRQYTDDQYATLTNRQLADLAAQFPAVFMLRTPSPVAGDRFDDELPGSGPNRFLYQIASVSTAGVVGARSPVWAPVRIPDTVPPPSPVVKNATVEDGVVTVRWTQAADALVDAFVVYRAAAKENAADVVLMEPRHLPRAYLRRSGDVVEFDDGDTVDGRTYWYRVAAVREVATPVAVNLESRPSQAIQVKAIRTTPPDPAMLAAPVWDSATRRVSLAWTAQPGTTSYVQRSLEGTQWRTLASLTTATAWEDDLSGDPARMQAWYRIKSMTPGGRASFSDTANVPLP
jgi:hypothetical protein